MDKNAIKKYAVWARRELISRVSQKALQYGISDAGFGDKNADSVNGILLTADQKKQRKALIEKIEQYGADKKAFEQVIEEVAYTWFNRFTALRFMEVNGYLPTHIRVFTDDNNEFKPQILAEAIYLDLDGLKQDVVFKLKEENKEEELYKYLLITQCNALNSVLPIMFQKISDYTELLFPDNLLRDGSVLERMIAEIPETDWKDAVQIIGWLYQHYNSEPKDKVFADLKKNIKISRENIPAATQLFTPDWIVRYMVENSLGKLWLEGHPNDELKSGLKYYIEEAEQEASVQAKLDEIRKGYAALAPRDIKCIDPCMGSGHILVYLFDVLVQIYTSAGYSTRDAVRSIVENNLYGLDIDERATQLAYFAVMMKACAYDSRFLSRGVQPHIYAIRESNNLDEHMLAYYCRGDKNLTNDLTCILNDMVDAKEFGSILQIKPVDFDALYARFNEIIDDVDLYRESVLTELLPVVRVAEVLSNRYDIVITNPPYMGNSGMSAKLSDFVKSKYPDSKTDLFAVFIESCGAMVKQNGMQAMITQHAWMFLSSFEKLRRKIIDTREIDSMLHLGAHAFEDIGGEVVQTTTFVIRNNRQQGYKAIYCRLVDANSQQSKEELFLSGKNRSTIESEEFALIPGTPVAYWVSEGIYNIFKNTLFFDLSISDGKNVTGNNDKFLRLFWEVNIENFGQNKKWLAYVKGGSPRKWYGNFDYVIDWSDEARTFYRKDKVCRIIPEYLWYKKGITWTLISSGNPSFRIKPNIATFDGGGLTIFLKNEENLNYYMAMLNSPVFEAIQKIINPTLNLLIKDIRSVPMIIDEAQKPQINDLVETNIRLSQKDWDAFETSWDFFKHPLFRNFSTIKEAYKEWETECKARFDMLKANEEQLNRIFIDIYGLQDELTPEVDDRDVTVRLAVLQREIKSLISYAVGCMFGRYSPDVEGLAYAGGEWEASKYRTFIPDADNIIPICDDEYFEDDIVGRFVQFVKVVYGEDTLEENLSFIANALGGNGSARDVIRGYFNNGFYADHLKTYQKRPIYWLFDSGKKGGFKALIYMHRYKPDTIARMRTDYVHE